MRYEKGRKRKRDRLSAATLTPRRRWRGAQLSPFASIVMRSGDGLVKLERHKWGKLYNTGVLQFCDLFVRICCSRSL